MGLAHQVQLGRLDKQQEARLVVTIIPKSTESTFSTPVPRWIWLFMISGMVAAISCFVPLSISPPRGVIQTVHLLLSPEFDLMMLTAQACQLFIHVYLYVMQPEGVY
jgi:hypothetical protein